MRSCVAGLIVMLVLSTLSGTEKVVLKVFALTDPEKTDIFTQADLAVLNAFREQFPHIELRSFSGLQIENMEMDTVPLMAIAGGVSPDILYVNFRQSDTYVQNDFLYPLDEFITRQDSSEMHLRVEKPVWPVIRRTRVETGQKSVWMLPYETLVRVLLYRKDMFYKAGLDPNHPPRDWDELYHYARRLTNPQKGEYGIFLAGGPQAAYDWITYLWSAGGDAVVETDEGWRAVFASSAGVTAMEFYLKLITTPWKDALGRQQHGFAYRDWEWGRLFSEGKLAMRLDYLSQQNFGGKFTGGNIDYNLVGIAPVPKGPTGIRGAELNCRMMGIFSGAGISNNAGLGDRDPEAVREAAWSYIWFFDSEQARRIRTRVLVQNGFARMVNPVYLKRYGYEEYLKHSPEGWLETFEEALRNGKPEPYGRNCQKIYEYMTIPIEQCISLERKGELGNTPEQRHDNILAILLEAQERTNRDMIGTLPPQERVRRNRIAAAVVALIFLAFLFMVFGVWKIFSGIPHRSFGHFNKQWFGILLMLFPAVGSILVWKYLPLVMGSTISFQDYSLVGDSSWIGFENFADVLWDPYWWQALGKTLYFMALMLALGFFPPVILAVLLQEVSHGKILYRVIYYLPAVISGVIVVYLWKLLYDPSDAGGFNQLLRWLGMPKSMWLRDENLAMLCVVLPTIWAGLGPGSLLYLAALKTIPDELYESADLDGAGFFQKLRYIVLPSLKPLLIIQFVAAFIAAAQQSEFILVMTFGGPNQATQVADLMIFQKAYLYLRFGLATSMAWLLSILLMGFTVMQLRYLSKMEFKTVKG